MGTKLFLRNSVLGSGRPWPEFYGIPGILRPGRNFWLFEELVSIAKLFQLDHQRDFIEAAISEKRNLPSFWQTRRWLVSRTENLFRTEPKKIRDCFGNEVAKKLKFRSNESSEVQKNLAERLLVRATLWRTELTNCRSANCRKIRVRFVSEKQSVHVGNMGRVVQNRVGNLVNLFLYWPDPGLLLFIDSEVKLPHAQQKLISN